MNRYSLYLVFAVLALGADTANAQSTSDRAGTWDFGIMMMETWKAS